jgi:hypothetical protein
MSACAIKHWGTGTPCVKTNPATNEMTEKLKAMQAEREKQDAMWQAPLPQNLKKNIKKQ